MNILANLKQLIEVEDKVLLAVSGGIDSMVMLDLFAKQFPKYKIGIAHCNFSLRGEDSLKDMLLVEKIAKQYGIELHKIIFDTNKEMELRGKNLQETARELRYEWFDKICKEYGFEKIATAHNKNDNIETFFVNCVRGTGIRGLTAIPVVNGKIIRPVIELTRDEIVKYAQQNNIEFRDDKSNATTKYLRNALRHNIIPQLIEKNDNFIEVMSDNIERIKQSVAFLDYSIKKIENEVMEVRNSTTYIDMNKLSQQSQNQYVLYEILHKMGFSKVITESIYNCFKKQISGKTFNSKSHTAYLNRSTIEVVEQVTKSFCIDVLKDSAEWIINKNTFTQNVVPYTSDINLKSDKYTAFLDYDKLEQTLQIRNWKHGDSFYPFGMKQSKQLSDFFIDNKISISKKNSYPIVCSGDDIIWVAGLRIDNRYAVNQNTKRVLISKLLLSE